MEECMEYRGRNRWRGRRRDKWRDRESDCPEKDIKKIVA
jgi:hypothetical protein